MPLGCCEKFQAIQEIRFNIQILSTEKYTYGDFVSKYL